MAKVDEAQVTSRHATGEVGMMKALVYRIAADGATSHAWTDKPRPRIQDPGDAIVRMVTSTICGTDLHILRGDVPSVSDGRILGHEGVGVVEETGGGVTEFRPGDRVIISCITSCSRCEFCKRGMLSHCKHGGWILGNLIDGTQAEYVRIPYADGSLYHVPAGADEDALVMLSDTLPTAYECGVLNGQIRPGDTVAIVGAGPIGIAGLLTAQLFSPSKIYVIDLDESRLALAKQLGATDVVNSGKSDASARVLALTEGRGVDVAMEAVGVPAAIELCQEIVGAGGRIANIGVHGKPVTLHLERLWDRNITLTTRLVDTVTLPTLLDLVSSGKLQINPLVTHHFDLHDIQKAYDTFQHAARENALKIVLRSVEQ
jgi:alcohol dehydrogenase